MDDATGPGDRSATGSLTRPRDAALGILFAIGVVMTLARDDLRPLGLLLMVVSAVVFLVSTVVRHRRGH
jgi:drug/metabolite transporter (DMT)-like permease